MPSIHKMGKHKKQKKKRQELNWHFLALSSRNETLNLTKPPGFNIKWRIEDSVAKLTMYRIHNTWVSYVSSTLSSRLIPKSEILHIPFSSTRMLRAARSCIHKYKSFNLSKLCNHQSKISYIFSTKLDRKLFPATIYW